MNEILPEPLQIPGPNVVSISVLQAKIWNIVPNLISGSFRFSIAATDSHGAYDVTVNIPKGLYTYTLLSAAVRRALVSQLNETYDVADFTQYVTVDADLAQGRILLTLAEPCTVTLNAELGALLGFSSLTLSSTSTLQSFTADGDAEFNKVDTFIVRTDITSMGIPSRGAYTGVIAIVPIQSPPFTQVIYQPAKPVTVSCTDLSRGAEIRNFRIDITDQNGNVLNFGQEKYGWSVLLEISFF